MSEIKLEKLDDNRWLVPQTGGMRVPGIIYANEKLFQLLKGDESVKQVANVAHLPGIVNFSLAMPDVHWGYGFPIGGVAAFDLDGGIISPGGVGYDINCGCRLMTTNLTLGDIEDRLSDLTTALYQRIPSGVGSTGSVKLSGKDQKKVLEEGAAWAVKAGFGFAEDLETTEDGGSIMGADPGEWRARWSAASNWARWGPAIIFWKLKWCRKYSMKKGECLVYIRTNCRDDSYGFTRPGVSDLR